MPRFTGLFLTVLLTFCSDLARGQSSETLCSNVQELFFESQLHNQTAASDLECVLGKVCTDENSLNGGDATVAPLNVQHHSGNALPDVAEAYYNADLFRRVNWLGWLRIDQHLSQPESRCYFLKENGPGRYLYEIYDNKPDMCRDYSHLAHVYRCLGRSYLSQTAAISRYRDGIWG